MALIESSNGYFEIQNYRLRRLLDLSFQSICLCLERSLRDRRVSKILDVGAGRMPYWPLVKGLKYVSVDPQEARADYAALDAVPLEESFDVIWLLETLEHLPKPELLLEQIVIRLRKNPGAELWVSVPYGVRFHMSPQDYRRWTDEGLRLLLEERGLRLVGAVEERGSEFCNAVARLNVFFFRRIRRPIFWIPCLLYGLSLFPVVMFLAQWDLYRGPSKSGDPLGLFVRCRI